MEQHKLNIQQGNIVYQQVNMQGQAAMKAVLLINAGASVAMLAFIGTAMNNGTDNELLLKLCSSMKMFVWGTLSAAIASGVTYLAGLAGATADNTNQPDKNELTWWQKLWQILSSWRKLWKALSSWKKLNNIAIGSVIAGYVFFIIGAFNAYFAFTNSMS